MNLKPNVGMIACTTLKFGDTNYNNIPNNNGWRMLVVCFTSYLLFSIAVLPHSIFCAKRTEIVYTQSLWKVVDNFRSNMYETCLVITHEPDMRLDPEANRGPLD